MLSSINGRASFPFPLWLYSISRGFADFCRFDRTLPLFPMQATLGEPGKGGNGSFQLGNACGFDVGSWETKANTKN